MAKKKKTDNQWYERQKTIIKTKQHETHQNWG